MYQGAYGTVAATPSPVFFALLSAELRGEHWSMNFFHLCLVVVWQ
jgi:hypothetical protein